MLHAPSLLTMVQFAPHDPPSREISWAKFCPLKMQRDQFLIALEQVGDGSFGDKNSSIPKRLVDFRNAPV